MGRMLAETRFDACDIAALLTRLPPRLHVCANARGLRRFGENELARLDGGYPKGWNPWFELFVNTSESRGFPFLHQDMCSTHANVMQVQGRKRFVCFPPTDSEFLYRDGGFGTRSRIPSEQIMAGEVDLERFPLYAQAHPSVVDLERGDLFFVPSNTWHTTCTLPGPEASVSVGGNFVNAANLDAFSSAWHDMMAAKRLAARGAATMSKGAR